MSINLTHPQVTMQLYETDISKLQRFIDREKTEGEFTEEYLILYDFADDCRYAECIQPDLIRYLLPFYYKTAEQAVIHKNLSAADIYCHFNSMIFYNRKNFKCAAGEENDKYIMEYYMALTLKIMEAENQSILAWVSLFNTVIALHTDNIRQLFKKIFEGSPKIKYSFFRYLSVLLFAESDNLLAVNETKAFWSSDIWDFDSQFSYDFFWNEAMTGYFAQAINRAKIEELFEEVKSLVYNVIGHELIDLFCGQMEQSFETGIFQKRKSEFLEKISCKSERHKYWDS